MNYNQRYEELNRDGKDVWESIDRPMRPLVWQLNRIGLYTKFCCCGFPYNGEEEPKTHAKSAFIVLHPPMIRDEDKDIAAHKIGSFFFLSRRVAQSAWTLRPYSPTGEWHLMFNASDPRFYRDELNGIHNYETTLLGIQSLAKTLEEAPSISNDITIEDGNSKYGDITNGEWQVKPKESVTMSIENPPNMGL